MKKPCKTVLVILGLALPGAGAYAAQRMDDHNPTAPMPWEQIDAGLTQLAGGDGTAAEASFESARRADSSGLAGLLGELTAAYVADDPHNPGFAASSRQDKDLLDVASRHFHQRPVPTAILHDVLARIRRLLKQASAQGSLFLRPLLCNLRLLAGDRATDGEPVLEPAGTSGDTGPLVRPHPEFTPSPHLAAAAKRARAGDTLVVDAEMILDSEGCPAAVKLVRPLPNPLVNQALASLSWWAYEPARYDGLAVGWKLPLNLSVRFTPGNPGSNLPSVP